ncbi:uncharacterized protein K452DRAFT_290531 [Aplosporella prunicola CBS 121167]|uniref:Uncharacterized protein n=1 Tax=Aplosporella prunicola CBS 121167 TaxID=1176127 RepID=A0A6A6B6H9_9PEZI|nr:uncharacterized protein K452DRAFT_290531 [Aplosporella prunicola CBS 121167]KAF2138875.1 hypothetical protein K452DRAFT_290531 [Aplosporella prunicola CBS 121167]
MCPCLPSLCTQKQCRSLYMQEERLAKIQDFPVHRDIASWALTAYAAVLLLPATAEWRNSFTVRRFDETRDWILSFWYAFYWVAVTFYHCGRQSNSLGLAMARQDTSRQSTLL